MESFPWLDVPAWTFRIEPLEQPPFTWGAVRGRGDVEGARRRYLAALREADGGEYGLLEDFALS